MTKKVDTKNENAKKETAELNVQDLTIVSGGAIKKFADDNL